MNTKAPTKTELLENIPTGYTDARLIARATLHVAYPDRTEVWYHKTRVVVKWPSGRMQLNSGGYRTKTTLARLNDYATITQTAGEWWVRSWGHEVPFYDGIVIPAHGVLKPTKKGLADHARRTKLRKEIKAFTNKLDKLETLPMPEVGDCFLCRIPGSSNDHLRHHVREGYLHGSLLVAALRGMGYSDFAVTHFLRGDKTTVKRTLRRYLYRELLGG